MLFIWMVFLFGDYEIRKEVNGFCGIKWFRVEEVLVLVVDSGESGIKEVLKRMWNLNEVWGVWVGLKEVVCEKERNEYLWERNNGEGFGVGDYMEVGFECRLGWLWEVLGMGNFKR